MIREALKWTRISLQALKYRVDDNLVVLQVSNGMIKVYFSESILILLINALGKKKRGSEEKGEKRS